MKQLLFIGLGLCLLIGESIVLRFCWCGRLKDAIYVGFSGAQDASEGSISLEMVEEDLGASREASRTGV